MRYKIAVVWVLLIFGVIKAPWEQYLERERYQIMYGDIPPISFELRDSLGQGFTLAALGGFRGLAANFLWISLTEAWQEKQWSRVWTYAELAVLLQPRVLYFWENGSWHLAYNSSVAALKYNEGKSEERKQREARKWIEAGRDMLERGTLAIPEKPNLFINLGMLYEKKYRDYASAAKYYMEAQKRPGCPIFVERFIGYSLENAGKREEAYRYWTNLWKSSKEHPPRTHRKWERVEEKIRILEEELNIQLKKRIFTY